MDCFHSGCFRVTTDQTNFIFILCVPQKYADKIVFYLQFRQLVFPQSEDYNKLNSSFPSKPLHLIEKAFEAGDCSRHKYPVLYTLSVK